MKTIKSLYNLLGINHKIPYVPVRIQYLHEVWGLTQETIADMEGISQSLVSTQLAKARGTVSSESYTKQTDLAFTVDEIRFIQFLPREIIKDSEVVAFVNNILGLEVYHPFYEFYTHAINLRIGALANMGVMNKHLVKIFNKSQTSISMTAKRYKDKPEVDRESRYDSTAAFQLAVQKRKSNFLLAGGQSV